jgi:hypothetical protein
MGCTGEGEGGSKIADIAGIADIAREPESKPDAQNSRGREGRTLPGQ